jgi:hypothetical protein
MALKSGTGSGWLEERFVYTAYGADPVFGQVFESSSRFYAVFEIAYFWIVDIAARNTYPFLHK